MIFESKRIIMVIIFLIITVILISCNNDSSPTDDAIISNLESDESSEPYSSHAIGSADESICISSELLFSEQLSEISQSSSLIQSSLASQIQQSSSKDTSMSVPPEERMPYNIAKLVLPALQWSGGPTREDGTRSYWEPESLSKALVNLVSVIYWPFDEFGKIIGGLPTAEQYQEVMDHASYDIAKSDELGVKIMGYTDTVQFKLDVINGAYGYTLDDLAYKDASGNTIFTTAWDAAGNYIACINQPKWREMLTETNYLTAKAGFECLMYDFYPYAASSYFCHCDSCQRLWDDYSKEIWGEAVPMPTKILPANEISIAYYKFRVECFAKFMEETASKAKKYYPDFYLLQNNNMNGYDTPYSILIGALDPPTSEFHTVDNGNESSLYMFQLAEALGAKNVLSYYNSDSQITPIYRYKVNLAESYAVCGGMMHHKDPLFTCSKFFHFINDRQLIYAGSHSIADVGVLYSWESSLFSNVTFSGSLMFDFRNNISRQAASALIRTGVTYDFVALEREGILQRLDQYKILVIPEYDHFVKATWEEPVKKFIANGGKLIVLGNTAANFIKGLFGESPNIQYVEAFTKANNESAMQVPFEFMDALIDTGATDQLKLKTHMDLSSATIRQNGPDIFIHIIRRGDPKQITDKTMKFSFKVPENYIIDKVTAECPYTRNNDISIDWSVDQNNILTAQTGVFDTYMIIKIEPSSIG
ncbi:MAG: beta-galactosidase trimerization domain-containing protein [Eubacteriales bacterium]|nr:beta-galactosidase trimerization domain-containing protein [Eubacteriales bacterium]